MQNQNNSYYADEIISILKSSGILIKWERSTISYDGQPDDKLDGITAIIIKPVK